MIKNIPIEKVFFLDIETVPQVSNFAELSETEQNFGIKNCKTKEEDILRRFLHGDRAGIMAEFGKIICISIGIYDKKQ